MADLQSGYFFISFTSEFTSDLLQKMKNPLAIRKRYAKIDKMCKYADNALRGSALQFVEKE